MDATMERNFEVKITGEPRDTESGHAGFGEETLEKYQKWQLAGVLLYVTSGSEGGAWKSAHCGNSLDSYPTQKQTLRLLPYLFIGILGPLVAILRP